MTITFHDWDRDPQTTTFRPGDCLAGKVTFRAEEDAEWIGFMLQERHVYSGQLFAGQTLLRSTVFEKNIRLKPGEERTYPFMVELAGMTVYEGVRGSCTPELLAIARPPERQTGFFSTTGQNDWTTTRTVLRIDRTGPFQLSEEATVMKARVENKLITGFSVLTVLSFLAAFVIPLLFLVTVLPATLWYLAHRRQKAVVESFGEVSFSPVYQAGETWITNITPGTSAHRIRNATARYLVSEYVKDRRGTSDWDRTTVLYESPPDHREGGAEAFRFEHQFSNQSLPAPVKLGDIRIEWRYELVLKTSAGSIFRYSAPLPVTRRQESAINPVPPA